MEIEQHMANVFITTASEAEYRAQFPKYNIVWYNGLKPTDGFSPLLNSFSFRNIEELNDFVSENQHIVKATGYYSRVIKFKKKAFYKFTQQPKSDAAIKKERGFTLSIDDKGEKTYDYHE